ncbi:PIN domain-containing protein [Silvibacterium sp.]|uniref:PIN domain-containing protein n=1 Tax=Silvibacterium sp. TaxID=1964179 RepID=UPI0039E3843B
MAEKPRTMNAPGRIVLDANILLRAVFGVRVRSLLETYEESVLFYAPDVCFHDAERYIPAISTKRRIDPAPGLAVLRQLTSLVGVVDESLYIGYEAAAKARIGHRDMDDWPIVASALLLCCPVWTEDQDFLGSGLSTWTTQTVELFLKDREV